MSRPTRLAPARRAFAAAALLPLVACAARADDPVAGRAIPEFTVPPEKAPRRAH